MFDSQLVYFALSFIHLLAQAAGAAAQAAEAVQGLQERGETEIQGAQESGVVNTITHNALPYLDKLNKIVRDSMHHLIASGSGQCGRSVPW